MWTEIPDILHNDFHVAYKYFTRQKITKVHWITELERILYKQKNACKCKKTVKLIYFDYAFSIWVFITKFSADNNSMYISQYYYQSFKTRNIYKK